MAKSSVPRHSKSARKPVTIELEPSDIMKSAPAGANVPQPEPVGFSPKMDTKPQPPKDEPVKAASAASAETAKAEETLEQGTTFGRSPSGEASTPAAPASAAVPPKTGDPLGRLTAGLIGGVVALLGATALQWAGVLP